MIYGFKPDRGQEPGKWVFASVFATISREKGSGILLALHKCMGGISIGPNGGHLDLAVRIL
jgi:hypothetical protein